MVSPGININLFDLTVYAPQISDAIVGCVGPATKGPVNRLTNVTDEGTFVTTFGRPRDNYYAPRAAIRYFRRGNQLSFVRVAGRNLASASVTLLDDTGQKPILKLTASSPGSWADGDLSYAVTLNGTGSYNIFIYFLGQLVEPFLVLDNGIVVSRINNGSTRVTAEVLSGAGATLPASTVDPVTGALNTVRFAGGDDGAFATTDSLYSSTGGVAGKRFYGKMDTSAGSRVFQNLVTITPALAGKATYYGTTGTPVVPGTFTVRVQTAGGPTYIELADSGFLAYGPGGAGLGLLKPAAGAHVGYIDYRTGEFAVKLSATTTFGGGTIDAIWVRANAESVGATAKGVGSYAGTLSEGPLAPGYFNANKALITVPIDELVGTPTAGASNASTEATLKTLSGWIVPGTVALEPSHPSLAVPSTVYDDGFGGFRTAPRGGGTALTGTINYRTGAWAVTWDPTGPAMPAAGALGATYDVQLIDMGGSAIADALGTYVAAEVEQPATPAPTAPVAGPVLAAVAGGAVDVGSHDYAVVFATATGQSAVGPTTTIVIAPGNQTVNGTVVPIGPGGTTARIIVRTKAGAPGVYFIVTTIADNVTTVFADAVADAGLVAYAGGGATVLASTDTGAQAIIGPIFRGSVRLTIANIAGVPFHAYDDGAGGWLTLPRGAPRAVAVTGTIDYVTGAWSITPGGVASAGGSVAAAYVSKTGLDGQTRRALRGSTTEQVAETTNLAGAVAGTTVGVSLAVPAAGDNFNGPLWLDHTTGAFAFSFNLLPENDNPPFSFDVKDGGTLTAVYVPASILGFGDGTAVTFAGQLGLSPYRRQANRLIGVQGAQASVAGAGEPQATFATLGANDQADYWSENVALPSDPLNKLNFRTGVASIKWTGAPLAEEAVSVIAEDTVLHLTAIYPGDIGNERTPTITTGFYVEVKSDPTVVGTLKLEVYFNGVLQEAFGQALTIQELAAKVNDPVNGSKLVTATLTDAAVFLGPDVGAFQRCGLSGAFTMADVIGTKVGQTTTGLQMFSNDETTPVNWLMTPGQWHRPVILALQALCEKKGRRAMGMIPSPDLDDPFKHRDFFDGNYNSSAPGGIAVPTVTVPYPPLTALNSSQLATIVPWVQYFDQYANESVSEPPEGEMSILIAGTPAPWYPIAGLRRGRVIADSLRYSASRDDRDLLYGPVGAITEIVNPIISKVGRGLVLYGQRTAQRNPSALDRINVRWTVNVIMNLLDLVSQDFVFEINDPILWREMFQALNDVLKPIVERRGLIAAQVLVDGTTTTPTDQDHLRVNARLFLKPQGAAEDINFDLILTPAGADFATTQAAG